MKRSKPATDRLDWSLKRANILKPQDAFEKKVDNLSSGPWKPLLTRKPHATKSLEESLTTFTDEEDSVQYDHKLSLLPSIALSLSAGLAVLTITKDTNLEGKNDRQASVQKVLTEC